MSECLPPWAFYDLNAYTLARDGVMLLGHLKGISGTTAAFAPDLRESLAVGDGYAMQFEWHVTKWARKVGMIESLGQSRLIRSRGSKPMM